MSTSSLSTSPTAPIRVALTLPTGQTQSVPVSHLTTIKDLVQSVPEIYRSRDLEVKFKGEDIALSAGEDKVGMDVHDLTLGGEFKSKENVHGHFLIFFNPTS